MLQEVKKVGQCSCLMEWEPFGRGTGFSAETHLPLSKSALPDRRCTGYPRRITKGRLEICNRTQKNRCAVSEPADAFSHAFRICPDAPGTRCKPEPLVFDSGSASCNSLSILYLLSRGNRRHPCAVLLRKTPGRKRRTIKLERTDGQWNHTAVLSAGDSVLMKTRHGILFRSLDNNAYLSFFSIWHYICNESPPLVKQFKVAATR